MRRKTGVLATLAIAALGAFSANAFQLERCTGTGTNNATVYLRWSNDYFSNANVTYDVYRSENGGAYEKIASGIPRLEYFDISVKPGVGYDYYVYANGASGQTASAHINVAQRNYSDNIYSLAVEYEVSFDELMNSYQTTQKTNYYGNTVMDYMQGYKMLNGAEFSDKGWLNKDPRPNHSSFDNDEYNGITDNQSHKFLARQKGLQDRWDQQGNATLAAAINGCGYTASSLDSGDNMQEGNYDRRAAANNFFLDGNRYLFIDNLSSNDALGFDPAPQNELKHFTVSGDVLDGNGNSEAAARYVWANVGYSWRYTINGRKDEKCWYISMMENTNNNNWNASNHGPLNDDGTKVVNDVLSHKCGMLLVWGPDREHRGAKRPYAGQPLFLDFDKCYSDYKNPNADKLPMMFTTVGFRKGNSGRKWRPGNFDGDNTKYNRRNFYSAPFSENGKSYVHRTGDDYKNRSLYFLTHTPDVEGRRHDWKPKRSTSGFFQYENKEDLTPATRTDLLSVKGNLYNTSGDDQTYANVWIIGNTNKSNEVHLSAQRIADNNEYATFDNKFKGGIKSIKITGFQSAGYGSGDGLTSSQNYVIPMAGKNAEDILVQVHSNDASKAHLFYLTENQAGPTNSTTLTYSLSEVKQINEGDQFNDMSGGCTFNFGGSTYLILPAQRQGGYNVGDFTIFRVTNRNSSNVTLTPVVNYTSPCIANKQYSTTMGIGKNVKRTMIQTYPSSDGKYVEIYLYLPGRTINMYTFHGSTIAPVTPDVKVKANIVAEQYPSSFGTANQGYKHQRIQHYDAHTGKTEDRVIDNSYKHLKEYYATFSWPSSGFSSWENYTDWGLNSFTENKPYYYNYAGTKLALTLSGIGTDVSGNAQEVDDWDYRKYVQKEVGITARPQYQRRFARATQTVWGNVEGDKDRLTYKPQGVTGLSVKVFKDEHASLNSRARVQARTLYRVDINFNGASTTATTDKGDTYNIPATRYEVTRSSKGYNGLVDDDEATAAVMIGNNTHAHWKNGDNTENPYDGIINGVEYHKGYVNLNYAAVKHETYNNNKSIVIPGNYFTQSWKNYALPAMGYGNAEPGSEQCVLSFLTTDPTAASDTYRVRAIYGTDNWNHTAGYSTLEPESVGVSQYADKTITPTGTIPTGVDDIATEGVEETDVEYFNLQGVRVDAENLTPGMYIRRSNLGTRKVVVQ